MSEIFATLWTVAHQTPPCMGLLRQEYWSELSFPDSVTKQQQPWLTKLLKFLNI